MNTITYQNTMPAELFFESLQAFVDIQGFERKQRFRRLSFREELEQGIAAMKLIVYGSVTFGIALDSVVRNLSNDFTGR